MCSIECNRCKRTCRELAAHTVAASPTAIAKRQPTSPDFGMRRKRRGFRDGPKSPQPATANRAPHAPRGALRGVEAEKVAFRVVNRHASVCSIASGSRGSLQLAESAVAAEWQEVRRRSKAQPDITQMPVERARARRGAPRQRVVAGALRGTSAPTPTEDSPITRRERRSVQAAVAAVEGALAEVSLDATARSSASTDTVDVHAWAAADDSSPSHTPSPAAATEVEAAQGSSADLSDMAAMRPSFAARYRAPLLFDLPRPLKTASGAVAERADAMVLPAACGVRRDAVDGQPMGESAVLPQPGAAAGALAARLQTPDGVYAASRRGHAAFAGRAQNEPNKMAPRTPSPRERAPEKALSSMSTAAWAPERAAAAAEHALSGDELGDPAIWAINPNERVARRLGVGCVHGAREGAAPPAQERHASPVACDLRSDAPPRHTSDLAAAAARSPQPRSPGTARATAAAPALAALRYAAQLATLQPQSTALMRLQRAQAATLMAAVDARDVVAVANLVATGVRAHQWLPGNPPQTPLMRAAAQGAFGVAQQLVVAHGVPVDVCDANGATALFHAAACGKPALVALLLARGADASHVDVSGRTALQHALWLLEALARASGSVEQHWDAQIGVYLTRPRSPAMRAEAFEAWSGLLGVCRRLAAARLAARVNACPPSPPPGPRAPLTPPAGGAGARAGFFDGRHA